MRYTVAFFAALTGLAVFSSSAAPIYLKADAQGDGSGSSWANAFTTVAAAVSALNDVQDVQPTLLVAQGLYRVTAQQTITAANFVIRGGYRAAEDGDLVRDRVATPTIFYNSDVTTAKWRHAVPNPGGYVAATVMTTESPVIVDNKISDPPAYEGAHDVYYVLTAGGSGEVRLSVASGAGGTLDGLDFIGFYANHASCIDLSAGSTGTTIANCRFIGNGVHDGSVRDQSTAFSCITNCDFTCNLADYYYVGLSSSGNTLVTDCRFVGNYHQHGGGAALNCVSGGGVEFRRCVFARNYSGNTGASGAILSAGNGAPTFADCVTTNNCGYSTHSFGIQLVGNNGGFTMIRGLVADNALYVKPTAGHAYPFLGCWWDASSSNYRIDGTVLEGNLLAADQLATTEGSVYLGLVGGGRANINGTVLNATFRNNTVRSVPTAGVTAQCCRGVFTMCGSTEAANVQNGIGVANCLFTAEADDGVCDLAQFALDYRGTFNVVNCIFQREGDAPYNPFLTAYPARFRVYDSVFKNVTDGAAFGVDISNGLQTDAVPFARKEGGCLSEPLAKTPGLRTTADISPNGSEAAYAFRLPGEETWTPLVARIKADIDPSVGTVMINDATGAERPSGAMTRGPVQTLGGKAEEGVTLTVRRSPLSAGTVSSPSTQATETDGAIVPVTATPNDGNSFIGWYEEDGATLLSEEDTLALPRLAADKVVVARFETAKVKVVFSLDGKCTFSDTGLSEETVEVPAGAAYPTPPAPVSDSDRWHFAGWGALPATVPYGVVAVTNVARIITKDVRKLYVTPMGAGRKDGSDWANASDDFAATYEDAAQWRGEVRVGGGVYVVETALEARANVAVIGGADGGTTIFTGDREQDDTWTTNNVTWSKVLVDGQIVEPIETDRLVVWKHVINGSDSDYFFKDTAGGATNMLFANFTVQGFRTCAMTFSATSDVVLSNCSFYANSLLSDYQQYGCVKSYGPTVVDGCRFVNNWAALLLGAGGTAATNVVRNSSFELQYSYYNLCSIGVQGSLPLLVEGTTFLRNHCAASGYNQMVSPGVGVSTANNGVTIRGCVFEGNVALGTSGAAVHVQRNSTPLTVERCRFTDNYRSEKGACSGEYHIGQTASPCISILAQSSHLVTDCLFESNVVDAAETEVRAWGFASAIGAFEDSDYVTVANCSFVGNRTTDARGVACNGATIAAWSPTAADEPHLAVVNCAFRDNSNEMRGFAAEIMEHGTSKQTLTVLNSILWGADGYRPFAVRAAETVNPLIGNSIIANFDGTVFGPGDAYSFVTNIVSTDPQYQTKLAESAGSPAQLRVSATSPGAKGGCPVYRVGRQVYFTDKTRFPKTPYRRASLRTSVAESVAGIDPSVPMADAFGAGRVDGRGLIRVTEGPVQAEYPGLMLLVR